MSGNRAEAEDAVAEAYLKAGRKAVNRIRAHHRNTIDQRVDGLSPDHVALVHAFRQIPADLRRIVVLHHLVGLTVAEIADEVGAPTGTVKAKLVRGRRAMAELLGDPDQPVANGRIRDA